MAKNSLNDSFIHLQVELQKLKDEESENKDIGFHYHQFYERIETRVQTIMNQAWIEIHQDELMADWELASSGEAVFRIDPLK